MHEKLYVSLIVTAFAIETAIAAKVGFNCVAFRKQSDYCPLLATKSTFGRKERRHSENSGPGLSEIDSIIF